MIMSYLENKKINTVAESSTITHLKNIPEVKEATSIEHYFDPILKKALNNIPDRIYFKIGEVADLLQVNTSVLRYWESEFTSFSPNKSKRNQRMYKRKDVEQLFLIKKLLYRDRFSIEGARAVLVKARKEFKGFYKEKKLQVKIKSSLSLTQILLLEIQKCKKQFT